MANIKVRREEWVKISHSFANFNEKISPDPQIVIRIQRSGLFDCELIQRETSVSLDELGSDPFKFNDLIYDSYLWILDVNEILRILSKFGNKNNYKDLYKEIKRIRMPLAKHERQGDYNQYGFFAWPILERMDNKIGWKDGDGKIFYRTDFATKMLKSLKN